MTGLHGFRQRIGLGILAFVFVAGYVFAQGKPKLGDVNDGTRAHPVHLIELLDEEGSAIRTDDDPLMPFSMEQTCMGDDCHSYQTISTGWHFNAHNPDVEPGRRGQPWLLMDRATATQLPLSYRPWPGAYHPDAVGIAPFEFTEIFGRHMPGGGVSEDESLEVPDYFMRWMVSGKVEINCLACHNGGPFQDQAEYAFQLAKQNYRWAAAAASGLATAKGSAEDMPDTYDPVLGAMLNDPKLIPPAITYDAGQFNAAGKVLFDIVREVPSERCYFCHSTKVLSHTAEDRWTAEDDVHLASGMECVDCHRNGLDHAILRGNDQDPRVAESPAAAALTCEGCHLGDEAAEAPTAGRLGAPWPRHPGIPLVHFENLACTACHSGPWPGETTVGVKTSRAHALGTRGVDKVDEVLPHIQAPVFARRPDGKIAPHKQVWPAFWGWLEGDTATPLKPADVKSLAKRIIQANPNLGNRGWPELTLEKVQGMLTALQPRVAGDVPIYVSGGYLYRLDDNGQVVSETHPAARPYAWAIGHDVRPAAQSLGIRGCDDCHSTDSPILFGQAAVDAPLVAEGDSVRTMLTFQDINPTYMKAFALSFILRPWLKVVSWIAFAVIGAIVLIYVFKGLSRVAQLAARLEEQA